MNKTFKDTNGFEIPFDQVTYINTVDGKQMVSTRVTGCFGRARHEVDQETATEIRAMFAKQAEESFQHDAMMAEVQDNMLALVHMRDTMPEGSPEWRILHRVIMDWNGMHPDWVV